MRVAAYVRVSTEEQAIHGLSIEAQQTALENWIKDNGHELAGVYNDAGISARKPAAKRPELQRLLRDVADHRVDLVIFTRLDRWFRNIGEYYKAQEVLEKAGVPWKAIHEDYSTQDASSRLKVNIMLSVSQDEADRTGERLKAIFVNKRLKGEVCSGKVPVGLKIEDKHLVPSDEAWKIRETFDLLIATRSIEKTTRESPLGFSRIGTKGILRNKRFAETGVVSQETFDKVQHILGARGQRTVGTRVYLFSGLIFCKGKRMEGHAEVRKHGPCIYYRTNRNIRPIKCVSETTVEQFLLDNIVSRLDAIAELAEKKEKPVDLAAIKRKMDRLTDLLLRDLITQEKYEQEYRSLQAQLRPVQPKQIDRKEILSALAMYDRLTRENKKAFWSSIIQRIDFSEIDRSLSFSLYL